MQFSIEPKAMLGDLLLKSQQLAFPIAEWENIISGQPVNLDVVHQYLGGDEEANSGDKGKGSLRAAQKYIEARKCVTDTGAWIKAWTCTGRATGFVFQHWKEELLDYQQHITNLFSVHRQGKEFAIIEYDKHIQ